VLSGFVQCKNAILQSTKANPIALYKKHGYNHGNWNKRNHRKFHRNYGRGNHGVRAYTQRNGHNYNRKRKKSSKGDLIAAGVIAPKPTYQYDNYGQPYTDQRVQLDRYGSPISRAPNAYKEPEVITYQGSASLEPWTPGWREWCSNRYRSFNAQTGTFRGYDGLDHFCVPK